MCLQIGGILFCLAYLASSVFGASVIDLLSNLLPADPYGTDTVGDGILNDTHYDFIVIGAGTAGSAVANRLSENSEYKILVLEAGKAAKFVTDVPVIATYFQLTNIDWGYRTEPQEKACLGMIDSRCSWPRGKVLGGSSVLNYMIHTRGNKLDYDYWEALGNEGWAYEDVLPYFRKSERFNIPELADSRYHNLEGGNLCVEYVPYRTKLATAYLQAGVEMGYNIVDYNGEDQLGFSYIQANMDKGRRCSAAKAYLGETRKNLDVMTGARVTKILIDEKNHAYGIRYSRNERTYEVRCSKEVILSAGTIESAKLLMLSGIGPRDHLEELGIVVVKDSKVGYNMHEHVGFLGLTFVVNQSVALLQRRFVNLSVLQNYLFRHDGPLTVAAGAEAIAFLRSTYAQDARPDLELLFAGGSLNSDDGLGVKPAQGVTDEIYNTVYKPIEGKDSWSIWPILQRPRSVGRLKLQSNDPFDFPLMDPNFFADPIDLEIILEGVKLAINISQSEPFQKYGTRLHDIKIPGCEYFDFASDDYWRCAIKHLTIAMNHELGTVKMGPSSDPDAVVDPQLSVYGVTGLRVADASVMPTLVTAHTNSPTTMIGEKVAHMIKQSWRRSDEYVTSDSPILIV